MELSHRVVAVLSAQVQRQTNKTASEMLSNCLNFESLQSLKLFNKSITTTVFQQFHCSSIFLSNECLRLRAVLLAKKDKFIFRWCFDPGADLWKDAKGVDRRFSAMSPGKKISHYYGSISS